MSRIRTWGLLGLLLSLCACVSTHFTAPRLTIISASMVSADVFSQQFRIRLHVDNPNNRELPIKGIEYKLFLQGDPFAEGISDQPFVVPAHGQAEFDTLVSTNFVSSIGRLLDRLNTKGSNKVQYAFTGNVQLSQGLLRRIPFSEVGMVDLNTWKAP